MLSQTLSEKTKELDKLRSEWTSQTSSLSSLHSQELQSERQKAVEVNLLGTMFLMWLFIKGNSILKIKLSKEDLG